MYFKVCTMDAYRFSSVARRAGAFPMEATVAERGQITLPKAVRDALGLTKGTILKVDIEGGRIILRKSVDDAVSRARGRFRLDGFASTEEAVEALRGRRPPGEPGPGA
jgi:antitoxin PrlF